MQDKDSFILHGQYHAVDDLVTHKPRSSTVTVLNLQNRRNFVLNQELLKYSLM